MALASKDEILLWHYHTPKVNSLNFLYFYFSYTYLDVFNLQSASQLHNVKSRKEKRFHIDDTPTGIDLSKDLVVSRTSQDRIETNTDFICSLAVSEKILLVARESGIINEYSVPNVALRNRHKVGSKIIKISINCNST